MSLAETHQMALDEYANKIKKLSGISNKENLKKIFSISEEIQNVIHCLYDAEFYLPPLEVGSEDFRENPQMWLDRSSDRTIRIVRVSKKGKERGVLSIGAGSSIGDQSAWCPICNNTPGSRHRAEGD